MNSCRNCAHSRHDMLHSPFNPGLYCVRTKRTVAPPVSMSNKENQKTDETLRTIASTCAEYVAEE